jgi:hypothetical protein
VDVFKSLPPVSKSEFHGDFEGIAVGPAWFQPVFNGLMKIGGLAGWQGKEFAPDGNGVNVLAQNGRIRKVARMYVVGSLPSAIDGQLTLVLNYRKMPHAMIQDEIRRLDHNTLLGMTYLKSAPLTKLPMPFVLRWRNK